jgi:DNA-binding PadR family transcriptional regulator
LLTDVETVVLGLIDNDIHYGYDIEKEIQNRNIRYWTCISFSSIYYVLNKLEEKGYLSGSKEESENRPAKKVYILTEKGRGALLESLRYKLSTRAKMESSFNLGIGFLGALPKQEIMECLKNYEESIDDMIEQYEAALERVKPRWPEHIQGLYSRPISMLKAEREWLKGFTKIVERRKAGKHNSIH